MSAPPPVARGTARAVGRKSLADSVVNGACAGSRRTAAKRLVQAGEGHEIGTPTPEGTSVPSVPPRAHSGDYRYRLLPDRDLEIVGAVWRANVLTANHLCEMFFDTRGRGLVRLKQLYEMGVLDRFRPYREGGGSEPYHYVLGREGAAVVAAWKAPTSTRPSGTAGARSASR